MGFVFFRPFALSSLLSFASPFSLSSGSRLRKTRLHNTMVASWAGDAVAPFFGFIGAAAALVFSCEFGRFFFVPLPIDEEF